MEMFYNSFVKPMDTNTLILFPKWESTDNEIKYYGIKLE